MGMEENKETQKKQEILDEEAKTDVKLVALTLKNQENFKEIINRYEQKLFAYIRRISSFSPEEAEDVLQEVFIKVYQNLNDFDQSLKFSSWIYRIAHNQTISNYRKIKARPQGYDMEEKDNFLNSIASDLDIEKNIDNKMLRKNIDQVLARIDIKYREVLILKFLEEKDYKEISDILKKPMGTVATLINRAKKKFREEIEKGDFSI